MNNRQQRFLDFDPKRTPLVTKNRTILCVRVWDTMDGKSSGNCRSRISKAEVMALAMSIASVRFRPHKARMQYAMKTNRLAQKKQRLAGSANRESQQRHHD